MTVRNVIARNTAFNAAGRIWEAVINILLTAYIVPRLGLSAWGLWALVSVFTGYVALLDFGIGSGFAKYIAEHAARDEDEGVSSVVSTGLFIYVLLGIVIVAVGWPCVDPVIGLIGRLRPEAAQDPAAMHFIDDARFLVRWTLVLFAVSNCAAAFTAVQTGLQRMGITNALGVIASLIKAAAVVAFLETGHGIRGLLYANAIVLLAFAAGSVTAAFILAPNLRVSLRYIDRRTLAKLFAFGWRTQVSKLSNLVMFQTDKVIVGLVYRQFGLIGVYRIGEELASKMRQAPALLVSAIVPAASDLDARGDVERVRRLYILSSKYIAAITLPLVAFTAAAAGPIIRTWMGSVPDLDRAAWVFRILAVGYVANIIPGAGVGVALGMGRPDIQMKAGLIATVSNIVLTVALVLTLGFYGIPLGSALSTFLSCAWFMVAMRSVVGVGLADLLRRCIAWPMAACLPGLGVCMAGDWLSTGLVGRIPNGGIALSCAAIFGLSYLLVIRFTPFLDAFDAEFLEATLRLGRIPGFRAWTRRARRV